MTPKKKTKKDREPTREQLREFVQGIRSAVNWLEAPLFTAKDLSELTGVSYATLRGWLAREDVSKQVTGKGRRGSRRLYSGMEAVQIRTIFTLSKYGVPLRDAASMSHKVTGHAKEVMAAAGESTQSYLRFAKRGVAMLAVQRYTNGTWRSELTYIREDDEVAGPSFPAANKEPAAIIFKAEYVVINTIEKVGERIGNQ